MKNVEDIYPLSPMQQAMLLHSVSRPSDDSLVNQFCYELEGPVDVEAMEQAWNGLLRRHPGLRTAFVWGRKSGPLQVVHKSLRVAFTLLDWSEFGDATRLEQFAAFRRRDRNRPVDPMKAPLMRVALIRRDPERSWLVWTSHHLILDRWCLDTIWSDLLTNYEAAVTGSQADLGPVTKYRDYIRWIQSQPPAAAEDFWRTTMAGFRRPSLMTDKSTGTDVGERREARHVLAAPVVSSARQFAMTSGVTLNILLQGALALALHRLTGKHDVAFGLTTSGRPPQIPGVEGIVGSLVSNVPVRSVVEPDLSVRDWLQQLQRTQQRRSSFEYLSPADIHRCTPLDAASPLFDTILVSLARVDQPAGRRITVSGLGGALQTARPLTIGMEENGGELGLRAALAPGHDCRQSLEEVLSAIDDSLTAMVSSRGDSPVDELTGLDFERTPLAPRLDALPARAGDSGPTARPLEIETGGRESLHPQMLRDLLSDAWREVLAVREAGLDEDFFDLGGDSLKAAALHARVEAAARIRIPLIVLFQRPTIRAMSELLVSEEWPNVASTVMQVRNGDGRKPPLFLVASPEVNTVGYALLARHLDAGRAAYVVQDPPRSLDLNRLPPTELPAIARSYVDEIRRVQASGPYHLVGMCTGAHLAHLMARLLVEAGESVPYVAVINTWAHYTVSRLYYAARLINLLRYYRDRIVGLFRESPRDAFDTLADLLKRKAGLAARRPPLPQQAVAARDSGPVAPAASGDALDLKGLMSPWIRDFGWPEKDPGDPKYRGTITVYRLRRQQFWRTGERDLGWGRHADSTRVVELTGRVHNDILREPQVQQIASLMVAQLGAGSSPQESARDEQTDASEIMPAARRA